MSAPINMALYRYLVAHGANEAEAEAAARAETSNLATKADLWELEARLLKHITQTLVWTTAIYASIVTVVIALVRWLP